MHTCKIKRDSIWFSLSLSCTLDLPQIEKNWKRHRTIERWMGQLLTCTQQLKILKYWKCHCSDFSSSVKWECIPKCTWFNVEIGFLCHTNSRHCVCWQSMFQLNRFFPFLKHLIYCLCAKWNAFVCLFVWHKWRINQMRCPIVETQSEEKSTKISTGYSLHWIVHRFFRFAFIVSVPNSIGCSFLIGKRRQSLKQCMQNLLLLLSCNRERRISHRSSFLSSTIKPNALNSIAYDRKEGERKCGSEHFKRATNYNKTITMKERVWKNRSGVVCWNKL